MNDQLLEELLNEDEGTTLDVKSAPYHFEHATDEQKSELLKDILIFANAWRRVDAYILVGVEDVKGGRSKVVGVTNHIDEAKIQQFVDSKTNRPIDFSYFLYAFEQVQITVIRIPVQERPFFLLKDYGKLKGKMVYMRRGSATVIADPDEIARMGAAALMASQKPSLSLQLADPKHRVEHGVSFAIKSKVLHMPDPADIPMFLKNGDNPLFGDISFSLSPTNHEYYREYAQFLGQRALYTPLSFTLKNTGEVLITNARLEMNVSKVQNLQIVEQTELPHAPSKQNNLLAVLNVPYLGPRDMLTIVERDNAWHLTAEFGNVQPKATTWTNKIYVGSKVPRDLEMIGTLYADNLPTPITVPLVIHFTTHEIDLTVEKLIELAKKRYKDE